MTRTLKNEEIEAALRLLERDANYLRSFSLPDALQILEFAKATDNQFAVDAIRAHISCVLEAEKIAHPEKWATRPVCSSPLSFWGAVATFIRRSARQ